MWSLSDNNEKERTERKGRTKGNQKETERKPKERKLSDTTSSIEYNLQHVCKCGTCEFSRSLHKSTTRKKFTNISMVYRRRLMGRSSRNRTKVHHKTEIINQTERKLFTKLNGSSPNRTEVRKTERKFPKLNKITR